MTGARGAALCAAAAPAKRSLPLLCALLVCGAAAGAAEGTVLHRDAPQDLGWSRRLASFRDPGLLGGFSRAPLPVAPGSWGSHSTRLRLSSAGQAAPLPGDAPISEGLQLVLGGHQAVAGSWWFVQARPLLLASLGGQSDRQPHADPRRIWTGVEGYDQDFDRIETALNATVGLRGLGHIFALSNEPFQWGEGIFGGIVAGQAWKGFPHLVLSNERPWAPIEIFGEPLLLRYEVVVGLLDDDRDTGPRHPYWSGLRVAATWKALTLSATVAEQVDRHAEERASLIVFEPHEGDTQTVNGIQAAGLSIALWDRAQLRVEYGLDDSQPAEGRTHNPWFRPVAIFHPYSAAWTMTADVVDVTGEEDWRLAFEWARSEGYFYAHGLFGAWDYDDTLIAHADGGNSNSLRMLIQHRPDPDTLWTAIPFWIRRGWRNVESDNENTLKGRGGANNTAPRAWDQWGLALWHERPLWGGSLSVEGLLTYERNRMFAAENDGFEAMIGIGWGGGL